MPALAALSQSSAASASVVRVGARSVPLPRAAFVSARQARASTRGPGRAHHRRRGALPVAVERLGAVELVLCEGGAHGQQAAAAPWRHTYSPCRRSHNPRSRPPSRHPPSRVACAKRAASGVADSSRLAQQPYSSEASTQVSTARSGSMWLSLRKAATLRLRISSTPLIASSRIRCW
jgi:hypothetical protein